jgi:hypothetical protein
MFISKQKMMMMNTHTSPQKKYLLLKFYIALSFTALKVIYFENICSEFLNGVLSSLLSGR